MDDVPMAATALRLHTTGPFSLADGESQTAARISGVTEMISEGPGGFGLFLRAVSQPDSCESSSPLRVPGVRLITPDLNFLERSWIAYLAEFKRAIILLKRKNWNFLKYCLRGNFFL